MNIKMVQCAAAKCDCETNYKRIEELTNEAVSSGHTDVLVFPEMWNTGFYPESLETGADEDGKQTKALLAKLSSQYGVNIVGGSVAVREGAGLYNRLYAFNRKGEELVAYDKVHLFSPAKEDERFEAGSELCKFALDGIQAGAVICYDLRFIDWVTLTAQGADILFVPASWPLSRVDQWRLLCRAAAVQCQCWVVGVNATDDVQGKIGGGHSLVVNPLGYIEAEAGSERQILSACIDTDLSGDVRKRIPVQMDRRTDIYEKIRREMK